jgi:aspartate carbamoyltransferase catalytic subunit
MMKSLNHPSVIFDQVTNGVAMRMHRLYPVAGDVRNDTD